MAALGSRVQVFIPVYNDLAHLPSAVELALGQEGVDVEVVVSDNASTDGTSDYLDRLAAREPRLVVHRNPRNIGPLRNWNRFFELVEAEFGMFLCSDDRIAAPGALRKALDVLQREPDVVSVYSDMRYIDGRGRTLANRPLGRSGRYDAQKVLRRTLLCGRNLFGIPLLHRMAVAKLYPFPDDCSYSGDVYLSAKTSGHGALFHIPEVLIENRFTGCNLTIGLIADTMREFDWLARTFSVRLSPAEKLEQRLRVQLTILQKTVFLRYARARSGHG